jgi:hypothetical protein
MVVSFDDLDVPCSSLGILCEVSPTSDKKEGRPQPALFGVELGSIGRKRQFVLDSDY